MLIIEQVKCTTEFGIMLGSVRNENVKWALKAMTSVEVWAWIRIRIWDYDDIDFDIDETKVGI